MPCERDMKYVDQLPNGYVFVEEGEMAPSVRIMAYDGEVPLKWEYWDGLAPLKYNPKCHKVLAYIPDKPEKREW